MKHHYLLLATGLAYGLVCPPSLAKDKPPVFVESEAVRGSPTVVLDPAMAYVYVRTDIPTPLLFTRIPIAEEQAVWEKLRADALAEARARYMRRLPDYERDKAAAMRDPNFPKPRPLVEPTEANFVFPAFARMAYFSLGPQNRLSRKAGSIYLQAVTPGTYRFYGNLDFSLGAGVCYCMGSVKFDAPAGVITDLGSLTSNIVESAKAAEPGDSSSPLRMAIPMRLRPVAVTDAVDQRLAELPRAAANFRAAGKTPNYFGVSIGRLPAIDGVLAYDRDRIIDVRAAAPVTPMPPLPVDASNAPEADSRAMPTKTEAFPPA